MINSNILVVLLLVGTFFTSTITILPAAYSERGDDDGRSGDENKQKVEEEGAGALNDCDAVENEFEDTTFENVNECIAIAATDESVIRDRETTPTPDVDGGTPPPDGPFTITGQGSGTYTCQGGPQQNAIIRILAQGEEDGTILPSAVQFDDPGSDPDSPTGVQISVTDATTDGNTFSLSGPQGVCFFFGDSAAFTVSGNCGTGVTVSYSEEPVGTGTFTADVECTLS